VEEVRHTGTGFPRVFYLRYHWYCQYFPLWALAMYRNLRTRGKMRADELRPHILVSGCHRADRLNTPPTSSVGEGNLPQDLR